MKTVCPNCYQKYEVPEDYIQKEVTCEKCNFGFFVNKAKFCPECGGANPAQSFECWKCHTEFLIPLKKPSIRPTYTMNNSPNELYGTPMESKSPLGLSSIYCPNCHHENEVPKGYMGEILCENCNHSFPVSKTSSASKRQNDLLMQNSRQNPTRISSANSLLSMEKWLLNISWAIPIFYILDIWALFIAYYNGAFDKASTSGIILVFIVSISFTFILVTVVKMFHQLSQPYRKIFWTPFRKICLWCYAVVVSPLMLLSLVIIIRQKGISVNQIVNVFITLAQIYSLILAWKMFSIRAVEDKDFVEADIPESKYVPLLGGISGAIGVVGLALHPLGPIAIIIGIMALYKGQWKGWGWLGIIMGTIDLALLVYFKSLTPIYLLIT